MSERRWLDASSAWLRILLWLYPADFRGTMGEAMVETYRDRCRRALRRGGAQALLAVWLRALWDSLRNGPAERLRAVTGPGSSRGWRRDLGLATRRLVRAPVFLLTVVATLTLGLGAFAVVYTAVHQVLLTPMPYRDAGDLYYVWRDYGAIFDLDRGWLGGTDVAELQKAGGPIESAAALVLARSTLTGREGVDPVEIAIMQTSPGLFDLLGVRPELGRGFTPDEVGPDRPAVIVLTHDLWTRLGADASILGSDLQLSSGPHTVVGVLPRGFAFMRNASLGPPQGADAYVPLNVHLAETNPGAGSYAGLVRARRGTPPAELQAAVAAVGAAVDRRDFDGRGLSLWAVGLKDDLVAGVRPALVVLGTAGAFLVLVLMANLAALLLTRAAQREQEVAVSRALGARPSAVARATLLEGGVLGLLGGGMGALLAAWATPTLVALAPLDLPRREAIAVDWTIAAVVVAVGVLLGLTAAAAPAVWAARASLASLLSNAGVRGGGGHGRMRRAMVIVQVALSLVLLSTGALVVRSFGSLLRADPGFASHGILTLRVPIPAQRVPELADAIAVQDRIAAGLATLPGVVGVSAANALPLSAGANQTTIAIPAAPGNTGDEERDRPLVDVIAIRAGYVEAMGMHLLAGRAFDASRPDDVREVLMDDVLARHFFPTGDPLGAQIPYGEDTLTVVGVVRQARLYDVHEDGRGQLYVRSEDDGWRSLNWVVRADGDPALLAAAVRDVVRRVDPQLALATVRTMDELVADALRQQRVSAVLVAGFAMGALLLAAMGLFAVVSAAVTRRRHELAMRLALGADHGRVVRLVMAEGARLITLGVLLGLPGTYFAGRLIRGALVGVSPTDPTTLVAVAAGLAAVALIACWLPAQRAVRIDPVQALRQE